LLFEIVHIRARDWFSKEFQCAQGGGLAPVVVFDKEGYALHALEFDVLGQQTVGIFFQILYGRFECHGRIDVLDVFESQVDAIDKYLDEGRVLLRIASVVEFRQLDRVDLDEVIELEVQNELFVGVGLAAKAGVPDDQICPGKPGVLVAGVAGRLVQLVGEVDGFREGTDGRSGIRRCSGGTKAGNGSHGVVEASEYDSF